MRSTSHNIDWTYDKKAAYGFFLVLGLRLIRGDIQMSWILGAGMGFLRGGPMGAVIGGALQHIVTKTFEYHP